MIKRIVIIMLLSVLVGCATLTNDKMIPITVSFSDGSSGTCELRNKRGLWNVQVPSTTLVRRSDDQLVYHGETNDGRKATGSIPSEMGAKIIASAVFLDLGIVDAITDKHRSYTPSFVIPVIKEGELPVVQEITVGSIIEKESVEPVIEKENEEPEIKKENEEPEIKKD